MVPPTQNSVISLPSYCIISILNVTIYLFPSHIKHYLSIYENIERMLPNYTFLTPLYVFLLPAEKLIGITQKMIRSLNYFSV